MTRSPPHTNPPWTRLQGALSLGLLIAMVPFLVSCAGPLSLSGERQAFVTELARSSAEPELAMDLIEDAASSEEERVAMLELLGQTYTADAYPEASIETYTHLLNSTEEPARHITYEVGLLRGYAMDARTTRTVEQTHRLLARFDANAKKLAAQRSALKRQIASAVLEAGQWAVKWAIDFDDPEQWQTAEVILAVHIERFPLDEKAQDAAFFLGEARFALKAWWQASEAYTRAAGFEGDYRDDATLAALLALDNAMRTGAPECPPPEPGEHVQPIELSPCHTRYVSLSDQVLERLPQHPRRLDILLSRARVFYDHNRLDAAIEGFEQLIAEAPEHGLAVVAANLHLDALALRERWQEMLTLVKRYQSSPLNRPPLDALLLELEPRIEFKLCRALETPESWSRAALCFEDFIGRMSHPDYTDKAVWNAHLNWRRAGRMDLATPHLERFRTDFPNSPITPLAHFALAEGAHAMGDFARAAQDYESFYSQHPEHERALLALSRASALRIGLGELERGVANIDLATEAIAPIAPVRALHLQLDVAAIALDVGDLELLEERARPLTGEAHLDVAWRAHLLLAYGYPEQAEEHLQAILGTWSTDASQTWLSDPERDSEATTRAYAIVAEALYLRADRWAAVSEAVVLEPALADREAELQERLREKTAGLTQALQAFQEVSRVPHPRWAAASLSRMGQLLDTLAAQLLAVPPPSRLSPEQRQVYREAIEEQASVFRARAHEYYRACLATGHVDASVRAARDRLVALSPELEPLESDVWSPPLLLLEPRQPEQESSNDASDAQLEVIALERSGQADPALELARSVLEQPILSGDVSTAVYNNALLHWRYRDRVSARQLRDAMQRLLEIRSHALSTYTLGALSAIALGEQQRARMLLELGMHNAADVEAMYTTEARVRFYLEAAEAFARLGAWEQAHGATRQALLTDPESVPAQIAMAHHHLAYFALEDAEAMLEPLQALESPPEQVSDLYQALELIRADR